MSSRATRWALRTNAPPLAKLVLVALADHANRAGECYPGQRRLVELTGISPRQVRRCLATLGELGLIHRDRRHRKDGTRTSDRYVLMGDYGEAPAATQAASADDDDQQETSAGTQRSEDAHEAPSTENDSEPAATQAASAESRPAATQAGSAGRLAATQAATSGHTGQTYRPHRPGMKLPGEVTRGRTTTPPYSPPSPAREPDPSAADAAAPEHVAGRAQEEGPQEPRTTSTSSTEPSTEARVPHERGPEKGAGRNGELARRGDRPRDLDEPPADAKPAKRDADRLPFLEAWNEHRGRLPAAQKLSRTRRRDIDKLTDEHGADALPLFVAAVQHVAADEFWIAKGYNLDNLLRDGRVLEKAEKLAAQGGMSAGDRQLATTADAIMRAIGGLDA